MTKIKPSTETPGRWPVDTVPFGNYVASEVELTAEKSELDRSEADLPCRRDMAFPPFESSDIIEFKLWAVGIGSWLGPLKGYFQGRKGRWEMGTILIIILLILLLGGGGGYYGYSRYGGPGVGGVLGLVLIILLVLWLVGGLHINP